MMAAFETLEGSRPDVAEVYSPPRVARETVNMYMKPGFALDLSVTGPNGKALDFRRKDHRDRARAL